MSRMLLSLLVLLLTASPSLAAEYAWFEGETPTEANIEVPPHAWNGGSLLSEGGWAGITIAADEVEEAIPEGGAILKYQFSVDEAGEYEVWGRIGMEYVRAPFDWKIDDGEWDRVGLWDAEDQTTDLYELARWQSIGWLQMGAQRLESGEHTLTIRIPVTYEQSNGEKQPQRIIWTADAFCVHNGRFVPNGKVKPGEPYQTERDQEAAEQVYRLPAADSPRVELPLHGLWQMARFDERGLVEEGTREGPTPLPDHDLHWRSYEAPGDRHAQHPELVFNHRYFIRTKVDVPADHVGRSFVLDIADLSAFATVYVNGERIGHRTNPLAPWQLDITEGIEAGQVNEIWIGIKDRYYALKGMERDGHENLRYAMHTPVDYLFSNKGVTMQFVYPVRNTHANGLLDRTRLISTGPVYANDVFAKPKVSNHELGVDVTLSNPTGRNRQVTIESHVEPWNDGEGGEAVLRLPRMTANVPAGGEQTVSAQVGGGEPLPLKMWWPDRPQLYDMVTVIKDAAGNVIDTRRDRFGYRNFRIDGTRFTLNGVPWQMRADLTGYGAAPGQAEAIIKKWREYGTTMFRLRFQRRWAGMTQREVLNFMDEQGVPVRRTVSTFDGQHASYGLVERDEHGNKVARKELFDNWRKQIRARLIQNRNNPSVFMWELDNEIVYINTRNFGNLKEVEPEFTQASNMILEMDPTHDATNVAGGRALLDQSLPVNGAHYEETDPRDYPDMAYGLGEWTATSDKQPWPMALDKPIFLSETFFASGWSLGRLAKLGGERTFLGRGEARPAVALLARMFSEGYRWQGLGGFHYWFSDNTSGAGHYTSWQPVAVFSRQWNWTFGSGETVERLLKVLNDTRHETPITASWKLVIDGRTVAHDRRTFDIKPGHGQEWSIEMTMPTLSERKEGRFILTAERDGEPVFEDVKEVSVIVPDAAPQPRVRPGEVLVWDPQGAVKQRLERRNIRFVEVDSLDAVDARTQPWRLLIVGPDALDARTATRPRWWALAAQGKRILVLDQEHPLHFSAVPADFDVTDYTGRIAFIENSGHPIFTGLEQKDFRTWHGDHVVYRNVYRKASRGARSLMQCDTDLGYSAIAECPVAEGLMLLSQAAVGSKIETSPVAQRLFDQMVNYALDYELAHRPTAMVAEPNSAKAELLGDTGVQFSRIGDPIEAIESGEHEILVVDGTPANLQKLAAHADRVRQFAEAGHWLMIWGVTPGTLDEFNQVVGVEHLIRPFREERVMIPTPRPSLMAGLSQRDVVMTTGQAVQRHSGNEHPSPDAFSYVVDYRDVAPFADWPTAEEMGKPSGGTDHNPLNMVNGFGDDLNWRYSFTIIRERGDHTFWTIELPRTETITAFELDPRDTFHLIREMELTFDGDPATTQTVRVTENEQPQRFELDPQPAKTVKFEITDWELNGNRDIIGLESLALYAERSDGFLEGVKPLLNIGTLVQYPMGEGGILLNQVKVMDREPLPINVQKKKAIVATLLQNLGAAFSGQRVVLPGEGLNYEPVSMENHANLYITSDLGWPHNEYDLSHLPLDNPKFAGVTYDIRNFETSPLESAVTVGRWRDIQTPERITGMQVNRTGDALFFLHTMFEHRQWRPNRGQNTPPVVWQYIVHYADGQTETIPVRYNEGAAHFVQSDPKGLKNAALAWAAPFPDDPEYEATIYAMQWNNPRPDVEIESIDLVEREGSRHGAPVLLGITVADVID